MRIKLVLFLMLFVFGIQNTALAKEFSYDQSYSKMQLYIVQKKYQKALDTGVKIKKNKLTEEQKKEIQELMESVYYAKETDDLVRSFSISYDKYENFYVYSPISFFSSFLPYIYANENNVTYKLRFRVTYYSRQKVIPDKIILHSDGINMEFKPFETSDYLVSRDTYRRYATAWVNLSDKEVLLLGAIMRGSDVSFKMGSVDYVGTSTILRQEKELIKKSAFLYSFLKKKLLKPGQERF